MVKQVYVPQYGWGCVESCVSIIRAVLGYPNNISKSFFKKHAVDTGTKIEAIIQYAPKLFPKHEVTVWANPSFEKFMGKPLSSFKHYQGPIPTQQDVNGNYIFMFDYMTYSSYRKVDEQWTFTSHTVVGYPAFAGGMWYNYIIRVSVDPKGRK